MSTENITPIKKEKNPNRVAGGRKGVEARKMREELLRKENEKLKEITMKIEKEKENEITINPLKKEDTISFKKDKNSDYILLFLVAGVGGIGIYYFFKKRKQVVPEEKESVSEVINLNSNKKIEEEIDPFEF